MTFPSPKHRPVKGLNGTGDHGRLGSSPVQEVIEQHADCRPTLSREEITAAISRLFDMDVASVSPQGPHFILSVECSKALFLKRIRYSDSARRQCEIMQFLQGQGFKHAVYPLKDRVQRYVFQIDARQYILLPYVIARPKRCWQRAEMQAAGQVVGQLHQCLRDMPLHDADVETQICQGTFLRDLYQHAYSAIDVWSVVFQAKWHSD